MSSTTYIEKEVLNILACPFLNSKWFVIICQSQMCLTDSCSIVGLSLQDLQLHFALPIELMYSSYPGIYCPFWSQFYSLISFLQVFFFFSFTLNYFYSAKIITPLSGVFFILNWHSQISSFKNWFKKQLLQAASLSSFFLLHSLLLNPPHFHHV